MKSMTGYGTHQLRESGLSLDMSVKSVNGRYLDIRVHLPKEYASIENQLKAVVRTRLQRGTVDVFVNRRQLDGNSAVKVVAKPNLGKKILSAKKALAKELKLPLSESLDHIIDLGGLIELTEESELSEKEKKQALVALKKAVGACDEERAREGSALELELSGQLDLLFKLSEKMETLRGKANKDIEARVRKKLNQFNLNRPDWEARWAMEISILVERSDISEELVRLREHISSFKLLMASKKPVGKKLDFYCQELLRETNTIGSKSQIAKLTHLVVEAKSVVEKLREQVQNVE